MGLAGLNRSLSLPAGIIEVPPMLTPPHHMPADSPLQPVAANITHATGTNTSRMFSDTQWNINTSTMATTLAPSQGQINIADQRLLNQFGLLTTHASTGGGTSASQQSAQAPCAGGMENGASISPQGTPGGSLLGQLRQSAPRIGQLDGLPAGLAGTPLTDAGQERHADYGSTRVNLVGAALPNGVSADLPHVQAVMSLHGSNGIACSQSFMGLYGAASDDFGSVASLPLGMNPAELAAASSSHTRKAVARRRSTLRLIPNAQADANPLSTSTWGLLSGVARWGET